MDEGEAPGDVGRGNRCIWRLAGLLVEQLKTNMKKKDLGRLGAIGNTGEGERGRKGGRNRGRKRERNMKEDRCPDTPFVRRSV